MQSLPHSKNSPPYILLYSINKFKIPSILKDFHDIGFTRYIIYQLWTNRFKQSILSEFQIFYGFWCSKMKNVSDPNFCFKMLDIHTSDSNYQIVYNKLFKAHILLIIVNCHLNMFTFPEALLKLFKVVRFVLEAIKYPYFSQMMSGILDPRILNYLNIKYL